MPISAVLIGKEIEKLRAGPVAPVLTYVWTNATAADQEKIASMLLNDPVKAVDILRHYMLQYITIQAQNNVSTLLSTGTVAVTDLDAYF